jgi:peptide/nickel transport system ATP-binding protein
VSAPLLTATDLVKSFGKGSRRFQALAGISLAVHEGETLGLVGESGCGKSTLGRTLLRLYKIDSGSLTFDGRDITRLSERALRPLRAEMQMVFQDPLGSLNPRRRVGDLIAEPLRVHRRGTAAQIAARLEELMDLVGQRQRIGIARALALAPRLIIADEPVSALDVSIQAQIVNLLADLQARLNLTTIFIAHDLAVIRQIATRTAVMYLGTIAEIGETETVLAAPAHPYTAALISAAPEPDPASRHARTILAGEPPSPVNPPAGCRFHLRCPIAQPLCARDAPALRPVGAGRAASCHFPLAGSPPG